MGWPVVTVTSGGLPVVDVTATTGRGTPVTEATNARGRAVTKVASGGMPVTYETIGIIAGFATLDGTAINTTLSNGNLTATHSNTTDNSGVRSASLKSAGKYYFEIAIGATHGSLDNVGIATAGATHANMTAGGVNGLVVFMSLSSGAIYTNGGSASRPITTTTAGDVICAAVDLDNKKVWFRKNAAGNWNGLAIGSENPATNAGGVSIVPVGAVTPILTFGGSGTAINDAYTINFGQSAFLGSAPSGFGNWTA